MAIETSLYQHLKLWLLPILGLPKDAVHIYIGFACLVVSVLLLRQPMSSARALILGVAFSVIMETLDLRDDYRALGTLRWTASLRDLVNTNTIPVALVMLAKSRCPSLPDEDQS